MAQQLTTKSRPLGKDEVSFLLDQICIHNAITSKATNAVGRANKKRKLTEELMMAQRDKELAMAAYFRGKAEKEELEKIKLRLEIEMMKKRNNPL